MAVWLAMALFWGSWAVVFYAYVLFPLLIALIARVWGRSETTLPDLPDHELPRVAMVVAAYNEEAVLEAKLSNTWLIDYPADRLQLVIGSDGSADRTAALLGACRDKRLCPVLFAQRRGKISVLNDLMVGVDADIVVMSDANTMFAPDAVRRLVRHFADPAVGCVSGELRLASGGGASGEGLYWRYENWIKRSESRLGMLMGCNGGIYAIRRAVYEPLPPSTIVEDFVLTLRILERGHIVRFEPGAIAVEPPCATPRAEMVRKVRIGAGGFQALRLNRALLVPGSGLRSLAFWGHKVLRWCVPLFLLAAFLANVALLRYGWWYASILGAQIVGMAVAVWAYALPADHAPPMWVRPVSYFYLMNFALLRGFVRFVMRAQRVTWEQARPPGLPHTAPVPGTDRSVQLAGRPGPGLSIDDVRMGAVASASAERRIGPMD